MIISKTPFRISFLGGGSDLSDFYLENPGVVISTTIDKYMYLSMHKYFFKNKHLLKYSETEEVSSNIEIKHNIIREVFNYFDIQNIDFNSTADIPSGTGMGSSSSFTCGLISICARLKNLNFTNLEIAKLACYFEIDVLNEPIGKQDQYSCAMGGLNLIRFNQDETVDVTPLLLDENNLNQLDSNLFLFYTSIRRKASSILTVQKSNTKNSLKTKNNLKTMVNMANNLFYDLKNGNIDILGEYLKEAWQLKKELSNGITNNLIDDIYDFGIKNGATGGKLLGAGGGGFILFYVPQNNHLNFKNAMVNLYNISFNFEDKGTTIVYNDFTN